MGDGGDGLGDAGAQGKAPAGFQFAIPKLVGDMIHGQWVYADGLRAEYVAYVDV